MLNFFKKEPALNYIFTPYKPIEICIPCVAEIEDVKVATDNLNESNIDHLPSEICKKKIDKIN
jgi:hypothetical protein